MMSCYPIVWALLLYILAAVCGLVWSRQESMTIRLSSGLSLLAAIAGLLAALPALGGGAALEGHLWLLGSLRIDALSSLLLLAISLVGIAVTLYSFAYLQEYSGKGAATISTLMPLFMFGMSTLVVVDNAIAFVLSYELITLVTYWLLRVNPQALQASRFYLRVNHIGMVLLLVAFGLMSHYSGSMEFQVLRQAHPTGMGATVIFLLCLCGFGVRAGFLPFHGWLPEAEPLAPSHISALMSGVMVKLGLFGLVRVTFDFLGAGTEWWGYLVLAIGAVSAVLGVLYALGEHDLKRLLAYHTVENIGIILMGIGIGMIGIASQQPALAVLGLLGGLYHLLNHAVFKSLLFMGTGSVMFRLHTRDMDKMGGLAKLMPWTALAFLVGALSISALPPLNGFVSEWFIYQSLLTMTRVGTSVAAPIAVVMLAVTGAMAVMCFVKVYGICFCGAARSEKAAQAREVPRPMLAGTLLLALTCLVLGVGAPWIAPCISHYALGLVPASMPAVSQGALLLPLDASQAVLSTPMIATCLLGLLVVPLLILSLFKGGRQPARQAGAPWACGYGYESRMSMTSGEVTHTLRQLCAPLYRWRGRLDLGAHTACLDVCRIPVGFTSSKEQKVGVPLLDLLVFLLFVMLMVGVN